MADVDAQLGAKVMEVLVNLGIDTPTDWQRFNEPTDTKIHMVQQNVEDMLEVIGMDLKDDSIRDTPKRLAKMYVGELFWGLNYDLFPKCTVVENKMNAKEMVVRQNVPVKSMCEHHFMPIAGNATVAYLPREKLLGLSKMDRIVDFFSRRPQVQERLTEQIAAALKFILDTEDVAVVIKAQHFCVSHRGVGSPDSTTVTSRLHGKFFSVDSLRAEFLNLSK